MVSPPNGRFGRPFAASGSVRRSGGHTHYREAISAAEAYRIGLISYLVPDGEALDKAREVADVIAGIRLLAVTAILKTLHETDGMAEKEALVYELEYGRAVFTSSDAKEGPLAFREKRRPIFTGT